MITSKQRPHFYTLLYLKLMLMLQELAIHRIKLLVYIARLRIVVIILIIIVLNHINYI